MNKSNYKREIVCVSEGQRVRFSTFTHIPLCLIHAETQTIIGGGRGPAEEGCLWIEVTTVSS